LNAAFLRPINAKQAVGASAKGVSSYKNESAAGYETQAALSE
jgi:hypothetical protein